MSLVDGVLAECCRLWAPPPKITLSGWAEANFVLSPEYSSDTGPFRSWAFQREPFDAVTDPRVNTVVIMSATQMMKTTVITAALAYIIDRDPGPILLVQPKDDAADKFSKERVAPMLRDVPCLRGRVADGKSQKSRNSKDTLTYKAFTGGYLVITSAGSPTNLAARPIRYLFCDEVDKYEPTKEGDAVALALKRTVTFRNRRKIILTCSPTEKGRSRIAKAYADSDQREFWVACHVCAKRQTLKWAQVKWDNDAPIERRASTARYVCEDCGAGWGDVERWRAVDGGEWRARQPFRGIAGFRISELYSPVRTLAEIVDDHFRAKGSRELQKTFTNTTLCEEWEEPGEVLEPDIIAARAEGYRHTDEALVPRGALFLTAGVDVQHDRLECEVVGWGRGKESWSIGYWVLRAIDPKDGQALSTNRREVWDQLEVLLTVDFQHESGQTVPIRVMAIDTGDRPTPVRDFSKRHSRVAHGPGGLAVPYPRSIMPVRGYAGREERYIAHVTTDEVARKYGGVKLFSLSTGLIKQDFYDALRSIRPGEPGYCHFPTYGGDYFPGLCSEKREIRGARIVWVKNYVRNEPLDCRVYARAAAHAFGLDRFGDKAWTALERQLGIVAEIERMPAALPVGEPQMPQPYQSPPQQMRKTTTPGRNSRIRGRFVL